MFQANKIAYFKSKISNYMNQLQISYKKILGIGELPDFYIIGVQKSGTTSLYDCLCQHPGIINRLNKEIHFFNNSTRRKMGINFYKAYFSSKYNKHQIEKQIGYYPLECEATPFFLHPWVPKFVYEVTPNAKLILIVRNPIDRALSHYYHNKTRGRENLSFADAINLEEERINNDLKGLMINPEHSANAFITYSYCYRGYYDEQLKNWLNFFPLENIHIVNFTDFIYDEVNVCNQIFKFLNLPSFEIPETKKSNSGKYTNRTIEVELYNQLFDKFYPHNQRFFEIINQDFGWNIK
jgi:hypothetical protein